MNKIVVSSNGIIVNVDDNIKYNIQEGLINKLELEILKDTKLQIEFNEIETKFDININIYQNVTLDLIEIKKSNKIKLLTKYNLNTNSVLNIIKLHDLDQINERNIIDLNGEKAKLNLILKTVCTNNEKYDVIVNHNYKETFSDIITHGVNISGNLYFNVNNHVLNGMKNCYVNQTNRIINLTNNECIIRPNLLIDELDVIANHSALIGTFKDEELFYMQRLGINKEIAIKLLLEGFITSKIDNDLSKIFEKYWR